MAGLFGDLDIAGASDNPFEIEAGTHKCHITDVKAGPTKSGDKVGVTLTYTIDEGEDGQGLTILDWKDITPWQDMANPTADEKRSASFTKLRLKALGIPEDRMNSVTPEDLLGKAVLVTTTEGKGGFPNIKDVQLPDGATTNVGDNPFG